VRASRDALRQSPLSHPRCNLEWSSSGYVRSRPSDSGFVALSNPANDILTYVPYYPVRFSGGPFMAYAVAPATMTGNASWVSREDSRVSPSAKAISSTHSPGMCSAPAITTLLADGVEQARANDVSTAAARAMAVVS